MTAAFLVSAGLGLLAVGYLVLEFGRLVLDDVAADREAAKGAGSDTETVAWLRALRTPDPREDETWRRHAALVERETGARP